MQTPLDFVLDPKVQNTVLITMVITSFLAALPKRFAVADNAWKVAYNFFYDWLTGFWSMKTGHALVTGENVPVVSNAKVEPEVPPTAPKENP